MEAKTASYIMTGALFLYMCMQPFFGMLADRIGRRNSMLLFGALGTLCTVPILMTLKTTTNPFIAFVLITGAGDRQLLHLDQRAGQSRNVSASGSCAGRGAGVRGGQRGVRRLG